MLYVVYTTYRVYDIKAGRVKEFCQKDKVVCSDVETARTFCWQHILDYYNGNAFYVSQSVSAFSVK